jgi:hypothetical protein
MRSFMHSKRSSADIKVCLRIGRKKRISRMQITFNVLGIRLNPFFPANPKTNLYLRA